MNLSFFSFSLPSASGVNVGQVIYGPDGSPYVFGPVSLDLTTNGLDMMSFGDNCFEPGNVVSHGGDGTVANYGTTVAYGDMGDWAGHVTQDPGMVVNHGDGTGVNHGDDTAVDQGYGTTMDNCGDNVTKDPVDNGFVVESTEGPVMVNVYGDGDGSTDDDKGVDVESIGSDGTTTCPSCGKDRFFNCMLSVATFWLLLLSTLVLSYLYGISSFMIFVIHPRLRGQPALEVEEEQVP